MIVSILSSFRNSSKYIPRYLKQMDDLQINLRLQGYKLHLILGYGDSQDGTEELLFEECSNRFSAHLADVSHGGRSYGSIEDSDRFKQLSGIANQLLSYISLDTDIVGFVESDLIWDSRDIVKLIDHLEDFPVVAPMIMDFPKSFYDVFAFRREGIRFTKDPPYHPDLVNINGDLMKVDSAGSIIFMGGEIARNINVPPEDVVVGMCRQIYDLGYSIWLDPKISVFHPVNR